MTDKSGIPLVSDLLNYLGAVPTVFVSLGFAFVAIGAFGDLTISNKKLVFGFLLISFGLTYFYGGRDKIWLCHPRGSDYCSMHEYDGRRHLHIEGRDLGCFVLWLVAFLGLMYLLLRGQWPLCV